MKKTKEELLIEQEDKAKEEMYNQEEESEKRQATTKQMEFIRTLEKEWNIRETEGWLTFEEATERINYLKKGRPATSKQVELIQNLRKELKIERTPIREMDRDHASEYISKLMTMRAKAESRGKGRSEIGEIDPYEE